jgi:hypothetical protein
LVVEVVGEGKTDVGDDPKPQRPTQGVVPILLHTLCGKPERMRVKCRRFPHLRGGGVQKKVVFAKRQAYYNGAAAAVVVVDSEGGRNQLKRKIRDLKKGRDQRLPDFPMAVGVAHPCIEAWLLADASAIQQALGLTAEPEVPGEPEKLPAPCENEQNNPKTRLAKAAGSRQKELSVRDKDSIAGAINDMALVRQRCPHGFAPFADEVLEQILPLFRGT